MTDIRLLLPVLQDRKLLHGSGSEKLFIPGQQQSGTNQQMPDHISSFQLFICQKGGFLSLTEAGMELSDWLGPQLISRAVREKMEEWERRYQ